MEEKKDIKENSKKNVSLWLIYMFIRC